MKQARLNTALLLGTAGVLFAVVVVVTLLHDWQMRRHAEGQLELAHEAEDTGDSPRVIAALNRYLSFDPSNQEVRSRYALSLAERASNSRERWRALQVLHQTINSGKASAEVHRTAARLAMELDEPEDAVRSLAPLLRRSTADAELFEFAARCYVAANQFERAAEYLEQALRLEPRRISSAELLEEVVRHRLHQPQIADAALDRLVSDNPRVAEAWLVRARSRMRGERWDAAARDLAQARKLAPHQLDILKASADLAVRRNQWREAVGYWEESLKLAPTNPELYLNLSVAQREAGQILPADETLRAGVRKFPENVDLKFALADLLVERGEVKEAASLSNSLPRDEARGRALFLQARLAQHDKQWLEAARLYVEAIQYADIQSELGSRLMLELAQCYASLGARDEQFLATMQAVRLAPTPKARLRLSELLLAAGRGEDALPLLRGLTGLAAPPRDSWGLLARALLDHHRSRPFWQRRWREMEEVLEKASRDPTQLVSAAILRAEMLWIRQESGQARQVLEKAIESHRGEAILYLALADLAMRDGDERTAREVLRRGDGVLGDRIDWLLARAARLAGHRDAEAYRELIRLEERAASLTAADRDRLERALADLHARLDNQKDVERLTIPILIRHPQDVRARLLRVDALLARRDETGARRITEQLRALEGENGLAWRCAEIALILDEARRGDRKRLPEAHRRIAELQKLRPAWSQSYFLAGRLADAEGKSEQALANYQRVLSLGDFHPYALSRMVQLLSEKNRWNEASALLEKAQRNGVLDRDFLRPAAWIAVRAGKPERARELAHLAVPSGTRSYRDLLWLGRLLDAADRHGEAEEAFSEAIGQAPDVPDVWLARLKQLVRQKKFAEADGLVEQMRQELPASRRELAVGQALEILGRFEEAETTYRHLLDEKSEDARVLSRLAHLLLRRNKPLDAEEILRRLLDPKLALVEEEVPELRRQLALVLTAPEQLEDRVDEALQLLAENARGKAASAVDERLAALARGWRVSERAAALRSLEGLPVDSALFPEERLRYAQWLDAAGDWPRARVHLQTLVRDDESNTALLVILIDGLLRHDKKAEASVWLNKLRKIDPKCVQIAEFEQRLRGAKARSGGS